MDAKFVPFYKKVMLLKRKAEQHIQELKGTADGESIQNAYGYLDAINDVIKYLTPLTH